MTMKSLEVESTGDAALDLILGGGIPTRSVVVLAGEPGSGKTVITLQMMFGAAKRGKRILYFTTLSEPAVKLMRFMQHFAFFDAAALDRNLVLADLGRALREGARATFDALDERVAAEEPDFVVIDSFKAIVDLLQHDPAGRSLIYDFAVKVSAWGATTLLVGEYSRAETSTAPEFGIVDGIIRVGSERQGLASMREIEILKLRGAAHRSGIHFFEITSAGAAFYPRVSAPDSHAETEDTTSRAATGIAGLDELLKGGLPRHGTTVIQGATGTGKTLLGLHFLVEGTRRGERCVMFTLEETTAQLRAVARSLGFDLAALEASGQLILRYTSPVELSTDRFLYEARNELRALGATRAVFDSLTTMSLGVASDRRFKEMVYAITKHLRAVGVTTVMTSETAQLLGAAQLSGDGVSFIADNVIQLRYVEVSGRLERAISVLKARGIAHDTEVRALTISAEGAQVIRGAFHELYGVLSGMPSARPPT